VRIIDYVNHVIMAARARDEIPPPTIYILEAIDRIQNGAECVEYYPPTFGSLFEVAMIANQLWEKSVKGD